MEQRLMTNKSRWYSKRYLQEFILFTAMFLLTMLHEWMKIDTIIDFIKGLVFFSLLYIQAQLHRHFFFSFFMKKKYFIYVIGAVFSTLTGAALLVVVNYFWIDTAYYERGEISVFQDFAYQIMLCVISTFTMLSFFLLRQYANEVEKRNEAQLMLSEINVKYLHAQLNPHFFFNMFNNLYGVSLTEPSRTPELILKLSELMRYQLENANRDMIRLKEEVDFIANYVAMEKERVGKRCAIRYVLAGEDDELNRYRIAPLLLITLIENAFKHSLTNERRWYVDIFITFSDGALTVDIKNSLADKLLKNNSTGLGLANTRQRLALLYPTQYKLHCAEMGHDYHTFLTLNLKSSAYE
ncbi:sensor histidine kinase [Sphingobacterium ginsenosidimutans]